MTFAVEDPDAIAAHAAQLGGAIVVEPFDIAPVRLAVLRDPQGADVHGQPRTDPEV